MSLSINTVRGLVLVGLMLFPAACSLFEQDCTQLEIFCAGLVTDTGGLHDYGSTQSAWDDIQRARTEGVIQHAAYIESVDTRDYLKNIDSFARRGYDVIITAGTGLRDESLQAADLYPGTVFIGLDQPPDDSHTNFIAITFPEDQAGFLAGALAAQMTGTGVIGAVCETSSMASNWRACEGFRAGARHEDPGIKVLITYRDNGSREDVFRDREWGHAAALDLIRDGADVIYGVGGGTGQAALVAAAEERVYAIGSEQDQFYVTREAQAVLLTSLVKYAGPAVRETVRILRNDRVPEREYSGSIEIAPFHDQDLQVSERIKQELLNLKMGLSQKMIQTGVPLEAPK